VGFTAVKLFAVRILLLRFRASHGLRLALAVALSSAIVRQLVPGWYRSDRRTTKKPAVRTGFVLDLVEATTGFEPVNRGFADLRVEPLHHVAES
jgi:hypothetical protein